MQCKQPLYRGPTLASCFSDKKGGFITYRGDAIVEEALGVDGGGSSHGHRVVVEKQVPQVGLARHTVGVEDLSRRK